jgi:hypothetical protein
VIDLYAITDHPAAPLPDVAPLRVVVRDDLAAVCAPASSGEVTPEALSRHEEVVEALMRDRDLLPLPYGTRLENEPAAARAVAERYRELSATLDRVRGAVELSLRVRLAENGDLPAARPRSGRDYLCAKYRAAVDGEAVVKTVHEPLSILARESSHTPQSSPSEPLRAAYLVDRPSVQRFLSLVARLQDANPTLRFLCTGPWPPYSFASP